MLQQGINVQTNGHCILPWLKIETSETAGATARFLSEHVAAAEVEAETSFGGVVAGALLAAAAGLVFSGSEETGESAPARRTVALVRPAVSVFNYVQINRLFIFRALSSGFLHRAGPALGKCSEEGFSLYY